MEKQWSRFEIFFNFQISHLCVHKYVRMYLSQALYSFCVHYWPWVCIYVHILHTQHPCIFNFFQFKSPKIFIFPVLHWNSLQQVWIYIFPGNLIYYKNLEKLISMKYNLIFLDYCDSVTNTGTYSCLRVDLLFKRQFSYYLLQIYIPGCMLVIVSWVSFWLGMFYILHLYLIKFFISKWIISNKIFLCYLDAGAVPVIT